MMKINETLKKLRQARNIKQNEAAVFLDVSLSSYQKYERDKNSVMPSLDVLIRLADFYGVTTDYLLGREGGEPDAIDRLAGEFNMTALEKKILDNYLALPKHLRTDVMTFLKQSVREVTEEQTSG